MMPQASPEQLVTVVVGLAALAVFINTILGGLACVKYIWAKPDKNKEFVSREDLDCELTETRKQTHDKINELETKIDSTRGELRGELDKLGTYQRTTAHEQSNALNAMSLKIERLLAMREVEAGLKAQQTTAKV